MDTYGDMVTLLLCFFVLLYSMSTISEEKYKAIVLSFNPNDRKIFYDIFEPLSMILLDSNNLKGALLCKDYAAFIDFLVEHME